MKTFKAHPIISESKSNRVLLVQKHIIHQSYLVFNDRRNRGLESVVYWCGKESFDKDMDIVLSVAIPYAMQTSHDYFVPEKATTAMGRAMIVNSIVSLAQFHTHPEKNTEHSSYDDENAISSRNGFLSLVAPDYGTEEAQNFDTVSVHEAWNKRWYMLTNSAKKYRIRIIDDIIDLRTSG